MFYNGNDYGKQGIGLAIAKLNEKKIKDNYIKKFSTLLKREQIILNFINKSGKNDFYKQKIFYKNYLDYFQRPKA